MIRKAIIAVAGSGTRFLPVTKTIPKEMLPIIDKPIIQLVVEEIVAAGIEDIIFVTRWDKRALEDHFDQGLTLSKGNLSSIEDLNAAANFTYVRQRGPYGNGTPVLSAARLVGDEPFLYAWGDDLVKADPPFAKQLVEAFRIDGLPRIGVQSVPHLEVFKYGVVKVRPSGLIEDIIEKPTVEEAPSNLAVFGRMILTPAVVHLLRHTALGKGNELWLTDAIRQYVRSHEGRFMATQVFDGQWLTTGDPASYLRAVMTYAKDRPDLWAEIDARPL